jgi:magnesium transporter
MAKELIKVNASWSVAMAIREMRKQSEDIDNIYTIYVVDDEDHIMGTLSMKTLIFASASLRSTIKELYQDYKIHSVKSDTPAEEVVNVMKKYDLVVVPVVNEDKQLIGRITIDDVVDVMQEEADKDYQLASGISEDVESGDSIRTLTRARLPWLLIGMGGGMSSAYIIGLYDITENPQMAIFMPLIAATGGNVGVQSAALVVKALANQSVLDETVWRKLLKELGVGSFNGLICSLLIFFTTQLFHFDLSMSITASIALFSVIVFASISGTYIPLTLNRFGIDPALATGPFITTTNDIIGLIIYFGVGKLLHSFLLTMPLNIFH